MGIILSGIAGLFGSLFTGVSSTIAAIVASALFQKALAFFMMFVVLPWVLFGVYIKIMRFTLEYVFDYLSTASITPTALDFVDVGAYLATQIKIPEAMTVYLSFLSISFIMRFIPGIK